MKFKSIDFFGDSSSKKIQQTLSEISKSLSAGSEISGPAPIQFRSVKNYQNENWTISEGIHIDRLCSSWLIRRFIDRSAKFVLLRKRNYQQTQFPLMFLEKSSVIRRRLYVWNTPESVPNSGSSSAGNRRNYYDLIWRITNLVVWSWRFGSGDPISGRFYSRMITSF